MDPYSLDQCNFKASVQISRAIIKTSDGINNSSTTTCIVPIDIADHNNNVYQSVITY